MRRFSVNILFFSASPIGEKILEKSIESHELDFVIDSNRFSSTFAYFLRFGLRGPVPYFWKNIYGRSKVLTAFPFRRLLIDSCVGWLGCNYANLRLILIRWKYFVWPIVESSSASLNLRHKSAEFGLKNLIKRAPLCVWSFKIHETPTKEWRSAESDRFCINTRAAHLSRFICEVILVRFGRDFFGILSKMGKWLFVDLSVVWNNCKAENQWYRVFVHSEWAFKSHSLEFETHWSDLLWVTGEIIVLDTSCKIKISSNHFELFKTP